ncbi:MAG: ABC transporter ATP-binding protein [Acidimicrobiia bacterium]|nr:ABC transporter ATP-binding protein [Acidimicrobiia bacterium]
MITTTSLTKAYGSRHALDDVSVSVPDGSVYGLVGPNGAGKTTLLGILAGLRRPTSGSVEIGVPRERLAVLPDTPQFEPWLTAREVVDLSRNLSAPEVPPARVEEVLIEAGLEEAINVRVGGFSRGMLQRLGLAATVIGNPQVLLLDEPSAALDPAGRREVLDVVTRLRGRATVMFSSHILSDVQEVCDTVGILRDGRLLFEGALNDLLVGRAGIIYRIRLREPHERLVASLQNASWVGSVEQLAPGDLRVTASDPGVAERNLIKVLADAEAVVISVTPEGADLEDVFLELTS